jgi:L-threonylcarbamoyladenylate synthase
VNPTANESIFKLALNKIFSIKHIHRLTRHLSTMAQDTAVNGKFATRILPVEACDMGTFEEIKGANRLNSWRPTQENATALAPLQDAARHLQTSSIPVAFPTETVYGLGADATRSEAVKGIYQAKGRPSDNPLIVHVCDLQMLRSLMLPTGDTENVQEDPIPAIYKPLIEKFWPGPLTILLPNPENSKLAPEVTAGLPTFGARMPSSKLALSLIKLAGVPLAAPSANASTKPSPTEAKHVLHDLNGRIELILDGGPCSVGVESTVVDGLCEPPVVLRPGGLSIDSIRECKGWEGVVKAYKDASEVGKSAPRAPGMKYKHYSPKAKVILMEAGENSAAPLDVQDIPDGECTIGIVRTRGWKKWCGLDELDQGKIELVEDDLELSVPSGETSYTIQESSFVTSQCTRRIVEIQLGTDAKSIAHGLFSSLRELDGLGADIIFVEGITDEGDIAAAVMNRLRKAASEIKY